MTETTAEKIDRIKRLSAELRVSFGTTQDALRVIAEASGLLGERLQELDALLVEQQTGNGPEPLPEPPVVVPPEPEPPPPPPPTVTPPPPPTPPVVTPPPPVAPPVSKGPFLGICAGTGFFTDPPFVDACARAVAELGFKRVRMGMDGVGGRTLGAAFTWGRRDDVFNRWKRDGALMSVVVSYRSHVDGKNLDAWRRFLRETMKRYAGPHAPVWIVDNETDRAKNPASSPTEAVEFTKIAWEARDELGLKGVVRIESPPVSAGDAAPVDVYLKGMLDGGLARYVDIIGIHVYGGQFNEDRIGRVRRLLTSKGVKLPIGISEAGAIVDWAPAGTADLQKWRADQHRFYVAQAKKHGFEYLFLFDLDRWKQREVPWRFAEFAADGASYKPIQPLWGTLKELARTPR